MAKARILIVDDEEGMLEVCEDTLRKLPDVELVLERQSRRAAERLAAESFDLLINRLLEANDAPVHIDERGPILADHLV